MDRWNCDWWRVDCKAGNLVAESVVNQNLNLKFDIRFEVKLQCNRYDEIQLN